MKLTDKVAINLIIVGIVCFFLISVIFTWKEYDNFSLSSAINDAKFSGYGSILSGLVGTIWSLASVILFYVALLEQKKEIQLNREDIEETRKVYIEQSKTQSLQRFENTFFQMLDRHQQIISSMRIVLKSEGKQCFRDFNGTVSYPSTFNSIQDKITILTELFKSNQDNLSNYFRNLEIILKFIDASEINDKKFYADIFSAQWSAHEIVIIFYKAVTPDGSKIKQLLERYSMLKALVIGNVNSGGNAIFKELKPIAFGHSNYNFLPPNNLTLGEID